MQGCAAKSSKFFYYGCNNYLRRGKDICDAGLVTKKKLESFIIDRIKANILTEENLETLVRMTNDQLARSADEFRDRLEVIDRQLETLRERRNKLFDALETDKLELDDVAPRLKEIKNQIDDLENTRKDLMESIEGNKVEWLDLDEIKAYSVDLQGLLSKGSIIEQKTFLCSFVKRIEVNMPNVVISYTIPLKPEETGNSIEKFYLPHSPVPRVAV